MTNNPVFYQGDKVKVKDVPKLRRDLCGKYGVVDRWIPGNNPDIYFVLVDGRELVFSSTELEKVLA